MNVSGHISQDILWTANRIKKSGYSRLPLMRPENVAAARRFHMSFPQYEVTPLIELRRMADYLGVGGIYVKDESYRFGLNAFKVLGCSYAMARFIADKLGKSIDEVDYSFLTSEKLRQNFTATFFTATDGNHGRGVAWAANKLGQKAVVFMPKGTVKSRFDNIAKEGATVTVEEANYDECVRMAAEAAAKTENGIIVQDTAWDGYEDVPSWIMQGYGTMANETLEQLRAAGTDRPTHVFVQAGVGSLAGAVCGYFVNMFPENPPVIVVMEARAADCLYRGAEAADGAPRFVTGGLQTIMAGLACGEPNTIAWDILKNHAGFFVSCDDRLSARGMRMLAAPIKGDSPVTSGESGAVGMGLLAALTETDAHRDFREALGLNGDSKVLMFSTEGDTDPVNYRRIVWSDSL